MLDSAILSLPVLPQTRLLLTLNEFDTVSCLPPSQANSESQRQPSPLSTTSEASTGAPVTLSKPSSVSEAAETLVKPATHRAGRLRGRQRNDCTGSASPVANDEAEIARQMLAIDLREDEERTRGAILGFKESCQSRMALDRRLDRLVDGQIADGDAIDRTPRTTDFPLNRKILIVDEDREVLDVGNLRAAEAEQIVDLGFIAASRSVH